MKVLFLKTKLQFRNKLILMMGLFLFLFSCGGKNSPPVDDAVRALQCPSVEKTYSYDEIEYRGGKDDGRLQYSDLRDGLNSACMNCHQAPARSGDFTFIDSYQGEVRTIAGETRYFPGYYDIAEKAAEAILNADASKRMPPEDRRSKNPEAFQSLGSKLQAWIAAGKPQGSF